ncbi:DUF4185 domain-containing protein [Mycolicibacterium psychrotolerans]|uniref:DUF4185 domain-containing protein n=1 Tax=Mycolicibacterium psychrotolerans TaxID=216929 RepID=UPI0013D806C2|nr:DUF4185 domain-containing protein [Mycolicibacterium psychrotolerans]
MSSAAYVGRVGALAVALGIGSVVFAGQAMAEDTDASSTSKPAASASRDSSERTETSTASDTKPASDTTDKTDKADTPDTADAPDADAEDPDADAEDPAPTKKRKQGLSWKKPAQATAATSSDTTTKYDSETTDASTTPKQDTRSTRLSRITTTSNDPAQPHRESATLTLRTDTETDTAAPSTASRTITTSAVSTDQQADPVDRPLLRAVVNVVRSMVDWAHQRAGSGGQGQSPAPPFLWALMSAVRRELESLSAARTPHLQTTALTVTDQQAAAAALTPYSPWLNPQASPSTNFVSWVTGKYHYGDETLANTLDRFSVYGTDVGTMWDNGMVDDPNTPYDEHQVLIAVGDTFSAANMTGRHIYNTLFRSADSDLSDGITITDGEWRTGNMFGGAPLDGPVNARPIVNRPLWLPNSVTLIPTAGVSLPTEVTEDTPYGTVQYVSFMSVSKWGSAGRWTTNYSAIAYSYNNGEIFTVDPKSVRYNSFLSSNKNFQQSAFVKGSDGNVYVYGTPNGRQGAAYLARVAPENILDVSKYEYYKAAKSSIFGTTPAAWVKGRPTSATAIIGKSGGFWGFLKPGYTVSEMSVQYNEYLGKYVVLYGDQNNSIVMRTSDTPEGVWSDAAVLMTQQPGGIYAPMLHPWSPSTEGTGSDLYWNLSLWSSYDIMLMRTDLTKV